MSLTDESKFNPIHTIPAPNLNKNLAYSTNTEYVHEPYDMNQIFDKDHFAQYTYRPLNVSFLFSYSKKQQLHSNVHFMNIKKIEIISL